MRTIIALVVAIAPIIYVFTQSEPTFGHFALIFMGFGFALSILEKGDLGGMDR